MFFITKSPNPFGFRVAEAGRMIEQPPEPDVPKVPDVVNKPTDVTRPLPDREKGPDGNDRPDVQPAPPPTDPAAGII
jgi:hypothetical protein